MIRKTAVIFSFCAMAVIAACAAPPSTVSLPPGTDLSLTRTSPNKHFVITLVPPETIPIQEIHAWRVKVATAAGKPVIKGLVYVNGGMPEHGHGLPTRPMVTREITEGTYLIEGMKFSMTGWWEILIAVQADGASDVTSFNRVIVLPPSGKR